MIKTAKRQRSTSASQRAAEQIQQLIFNGELVADSNHLESELADRLGISRTPVREATLMLQARGLLEVQPRKGVRINAVTVEDLDEICIIFTELECLAARIAAGKNYKASDLAQLEQHIIAMDTAIENNDLATWAASEEGFHVELVSLSKSVHILSIVETLHDQIRRARTVTLAIRDLPAESNPNYRLVYNALLAGNAEEADNTHRVHRHAAREKLIKTLKHSGLKRI